MADYEAAAKKLRKRVYEGRRMTRTWEQLAPGSRQSWIDLAKSTVNDAFGIKKEDRR